MSRKSLNTLRLLTSDEWISSHAMALSAALYLTALLVRALYLLDFHNTVMARVFLMDEAYYHAEAWNLIRGIPNATDSFFMTPLYPFFLSVIYRVAGDHPTAVYGVQHVLGAWVAPLVFSLSRQVAGSRLSLLAGVMAATFAPIIFFEALILVESLVLIAITAALWLALRSPKNYGAAVLCGTSLSLAILGRGSNLLLAMPMIWWFWSNNKHQASRFKHPALAFTIGLILTLGPLLLYNATHAKSPILLTANAGFNMFLGNGPEATGVFTLPKRLDLNQDPLALRYVQRHTQKTVTASEASHFWWQETIEWTRTHPAQTFRLLAKKLVLFWNRFSFPQVEGFKSAIEDRALSRLPFWHSYWLFPLSFIGLIIGLVRGRSHRLLALCAFAYWFSIALFFITDRYRVGILPLLIVLTAGLIQHLLNLVSGPRRPQLLGWLGLIGVAAVLTSPSLLAIDEQRVQRDLLVHDALRLAKAGMYDEAIKDYARALSMSPSDAQLQDGIARLYSRAGHERKAHETYQALLRQHPDFARGWYNLGNTYRKSKKYPEAARAYETSLNIDPTRESAWSNLGETYRALGDTLQAARCYRKALALVPGHAQALNNLGALRAEQGHGEEAERLFRSATVANRRYVPAWINFAMLLTGGERYSEALETWNYILRLDPENQTAHRLISEIKAMQQANF